MSAMRFIRDRAEHLACLARGLSDEQLDAIVFVHQGKGRTSRVGHQRAGVPAHRRAPPQHQSRARGAVGLAQLPGVGFPFGVGRLGRSIRGMRIEDGEGNGRMVGLAVG